MNRFLRSSAVAVMLVAMVSVCGCRSLHIGDLFKLGGDLTFEDLASEPPCTRLGCFATSTLTTKFRSPDRLGKHSYRFNVVEKNGILYTCNGGHIDLAHLRNVADWTAHLSAITHEQMKEGQSSFSFNLTEVTTCHVEIEYPSDWPDISDETKELILFDVSTGLGQYFAYQASIWHEIVTWFGYKCTGVFSEFGSSFSWEDTFSNLLGCQVGYLALYDKEHGYNKAVTLTLQRELKKLGVQSGKTARRASDLVKGDWFAGETPIVIMKGRNLDTGLDDGYVTPWIVPGIKQCQGEEAVPYIAPDLAFLTQYGFDVKFEFEPKSWERGKILNILYPNGEKNKRFEPARQLVVIMDYIKQQAAGKYITNIVSEKPDAPPPHSSD